MHKAIEHLIAGFRALAETQYDYPPARKFVLRDQAQWDRFEAAGLDMSNYVIHGHDAHR